jgi:hypothetical protein
MIWSKLHAVYQRGYDRLFVCFGTKGNKKQTKKRQLRRVLVVQFHKNIQWLVGLKFEVLGNILLIIRSSPLVMLYWVLGGGGFNGWIIRIDITSPATGGCD